jgi:hypothetical protein
MALPDAPSALRIFVRINLQDDFRDLSPIGAFSVGVKEAEIPPFHAPRVVQGRSCRHPS